MFLFIERIEKQFEAFAHHINVTDPKMVIILWVLSSIILIIFCYIIYLLDRWSFTAFILLLLISVFPFALKIYVYSMSLYFKSKVGFLWFDFTVIAIGLLLLMIIFIMTNKGHIAYDFFDEITNSKVMLLVISLLILLLILIPDQMIAFHIFVLVYIVTISIWGFVIYAIILTYIFIFVWLDHWANMIYWYHIRANSWHTVFADMKKYIINNMLNGKTRPIRGNRGIYKIWCYILDICDAHENVLIMLVIVILFLISFRIFCAIYKYFTGKEFIVLLVWRDLWKAFKEGISKDWLLIILLLIYLILWYYIFRSNWYL